eukprot:1693303-Rhodomonas_salina.1
MRARRRCAACVCTWPSGSFGTGWFRTSPKNTSFRCFPPPGPYPQGHVTHAAIVTSRMLICSRHACWYGHVTHAATVTSCRSRDGGRGGQGGAFLCAEALLRRLAGARSYALHYSPTLYRCIAIPYSDK